MAHIARLSTIWNSPRQPVSLAISLWRFIAALVPPMAPSSGLLWASFTSGAEM